MGDNWATSENFVLPKNVLERVCLIVVTRSQVQASVVQTNLEMPVYVCLIITDAGTEDRQIEPKWQESVGVCYVLIEDSLDE